MQTLIQAIREAETFLRNHSLAESVVITESIIDNKFNYDFRRENAKVGDTLLNDDDSTSLVIHVIEKDKRILKRGNHICPHQSQILGRDLHGETILSNRGKKCFGYYSLESTTNKKHPSYPYLVVIYAPDQPATNWTAFRTLAEYVDFLDAYGLNASCGSSFAIEIPEKPTFLPLTYSSDS